MTLIRRNPNSTLFPEWLEDLFPEEFSNFTQKRVAKVPLVNVFETDDAYRIELAVPGMKKEDITINLDKDVLTISAENEIAEYNEKERLTKEEYSYLNFSRAFTLPKTADKEKISAKSEDGILKISIMKKEIEKVKSSRVIEIS